DVLLPTMLSARNDDRFSVTVCMTSWLQDVAPWVPSRLAASGFKPIVVSRKQLLSAAGIPLSTFDTVVTASESTAAPHRFVHALVGRANALGLRTCTFQHGLENLGLTSREDGDHEFASQVILTWGPPE